MVEIGEEVRKVEAKIVVPITVAAIMLGRVDGGP